MGADIYLGRQGQALAHWRDSYVKDVTLNAIGLSYMGDIRPRLTPAGEWPLEQNNELVELIRQNIAVYLDGPNALAYARQYLEEAQMPNADPAGMIELWRQHLAGLIDMIGRSTELQIPLTMSI